MLHPKCYTNKWGRIVLFGEFLQKEGGYHRLILLSLDSEGMIIKGCAEAVLKVLYPSFMFASETRKETSFVFVEETNEKIKTPRKYLRAKLNYIRREMSRHSQNVKDAFEDKYSR